MWGKNNLHLLPVPPPPPPNRRRILKQSLRVHKPRRDRDSPCLYLPEIHCKVRYPEELSVLLYKEKLFPMAYSFLF